MDDTEEVIYSDGEPFEGYQYPNNTWDSDDSLYEGRLFDKNWMDLKGKITLTKNGRFLYT